MSDRRVRVIRRHSDADENEVVELLNRTIRVALPTGTPLWRDQILALALIDLLGRLFPRIELLVTDEAPADAALPPQIAFLRTSLDYSAMRFRDYDYGRELAEFGKQQRAREQAMIDSIRKVLADARPM